MIGPNCPWRAQLQSLEALGVKVAERLPIVVPATDASRAYLTTKARRMAHIGLPEEPEAGPAAPAAAGGAAAAAEAFVNPLTGKTHRWALGRASVEAALAAMRRGELVVVTDDESRENEGDLIMAASLATTEALAFTVRHTGGVICVSMPAARLDALKLPQMLAANEDK